MGNNERTYRRCSICMEGTEMNDSGYFLEVVLLIVVIVVAILIGAKIGVRVEQQEAIKAGVACYELVDSKAGTTEFRYGCSVCFSNTAVVKETE